MRIILVIFLFIIALSVTFFIQEEKPIDYKTTEVALMDLELKISERGLLEASRFVQIKTDISSNKAKLIELIDEGTKVEKNTIIARFDITPFTEEMRNWEFKINEANAAFIQVQKELEIFNSSAKEEIEKLSKSIQVAKLNLEDEKFGGGLVKLNELKQKLTQEERKLLLTQDELKDFNALFNKGFISKRERDKSEDGVKNIEESIKTAKEKIENYEKYEWAKAISEKEIKLKELEEGLESKKLQNIIEEENKKTQIQKASSALEYHKKELEKVKNYIKSCEVKAPIGGIVLYKEIPKNGKRAKIEIGDGIWQNQPFLQIPDTEKMIVRTNVREVDLDKVKLNMECDIELDAYPEKKLKGKISYIDSIAKNISENSNMKYFEMVVMVENSSGILRSGMSATIEIPYEKIKEILCVQAQALQFDKDRYFVYLKNGNKEEKRDVKVGKIGVVYAQILDGLKEKDIVLLK